MAGDLFYSQVDPEVTNELNWRKDVGIRKDNEYLEWQVSRTSWASVTVRPPSDSNVTISEGTQRINVRGYNGDPIGKQYNINSILETNSYRSGPVLENVSVQFADNSSIIPGILNNAQLSIMVPDIEYFNQEFEPYWLRAGLDIEIEFGHSVRTEEITNKGTFSGKITNFKFQINDNASVSVTIQATATSEIFTEVALVANTSDIQELEVTEQTGSASPIVNKIENITNTFFNLFEKKLPAEDVETQPLSSAAALITEADYIKQPTINVSTNSVDLDEIEATEIGPVWLKYIATIQVNNTQQNYVSLGLVVAILNEILADNWRDATEKGILYRILPSTGLSKCGFLEGLISTNPSSVLFPGNDQYDNENNTEKFVPYDAWKNNWLNTPNNTPNPDVRFYDGNNVGRPSAILISTKTLKTIFNEAVIDHNKKSSKDQRPAKLTLTQFMARITNVIKLASGNLIDLQLTTHPDISSLDPERKEFARSILILRDANFINTDDPVVPFRIPLFSNKIQSNGTYAKAGSLIRKFNISSTIPDSLKTIGILYTQAPKDRSQYYSRYRYLSQEERETWKSETTENYNIAKQQLDEAKKAYHDKPSESNRKNLSEALEIYNSTPDLENDTFPPPVFPLKVQFELDGVYGFRFGDVLRFDSLPAVYQKEVVFIITAIDHTITNDWVTSITCTMRPAIGEI